MSPELSYEELYSEAHEEIDEVSDVLRNLGLNEGEVLESELEGNIEDLEKVPASYVRKLESGKETTYRPVDLVEIYFETDSRDEFIEQAEEYHDKVTVG